MVGTTAIVLILLFLVLIARRPWLSSHQYQPGFHREGQPERARQHRQRSETREHETQGEAERRGDAEQAQEAKNRRREAEQQAEADRQQQWEREQAAKRQSAGDDWWSVLEVSPDASKEEIQRCYRLKMKKYHPDNVFDLGPEFKELADSKTKALNAARDQAMRARASTARK